MSMKTLMVEHEVGTIDFLKMKIEGGETPVLTEGSLEWLDRVRALKIELHADADVEKIQETLEGAGFLSTIDSRYGYEMLWATREPRDRSPRMNS